MGEAEVTHLLEAAWQYVLQEPTNKLLRAHTHRLVRTRSAWAVRERDHSGAIDARLYLDDSAVADRNFAHWVFSGWSLRVVFALGWKNPVFVAMGFVIFPEDLQGGFRQRDQAIFGTLSTMDMDEHSLGVDIFNMEIESFLESESQGVDDREEAEHRRLFDQLEKRVNFAD